MTDMEPTMTDMSHLIDAEVDTDEEVTLQSMTAYAEAYDEQSLELKELEKLVKEKKKVVTKLAQELLPNAMSQIGMKSMELSSGAKITIKEDVNCKVVDIDKLYTFLEDRGDDALMKTTIATDKLPKSILKSVINMINEKFGIEATGGLSIHHITLNSYFRKLTGTNGDTKCEVPIGDIDEEMLQIYTYYRTTIKR